MFKYLTRLMANVNWKHWLFFLTLSQIIYVVMLTQSIPRISNEAKGMKIFDMIPTGYSHDYAYTFLTTLSDHGYTLYKFIQLPLDVFFPVLNFLSASTLLLLLLRPIYKLGKLPSFISVLTIIILSLPLIGMITDYIENGLITYMLSVRGNVPTVVVSASSFFTTIKSMATALFYFSIVFIAMLSGYSWIKIKRKENKTIGEIRNSREEESTVKSGNFRGNASVTEDKGTTRHFD